MEALCMQLDNVHWELHKLQVENSKIWAQNPEELEQLREKVTELWQQLHKAQENEVGGNQHQKLHEEINELQQYVNESEEHVNELQVLNCTKLENKQLASKLIGSWAQHYEIAQQLSMECKPSEQQLEKEREKGELMCHRVVKVERIK